MEAGVAARRVVSVRPRRLVDCWQITFDADVGDGVGDRPTRQGGDLRCRSTFQGLRF
jgi:hypothetical protein